MAMNLKRFFKSTLTPLQKQCENTHIFSAIPMPIFWINHNLIYQGCSQVYADILGLVSVQEIIGKPEHKLPISKKSQETRNSLFQKILSGNSTGGVLYDCIEATNGVHTWIQTRCSPVIVENQIVAVLGIVKDISEATQTQRKLTKAALQDDQVCLLLAEINATCILTNDHHALADKSLRALNFIFDSDASAWFSQAQDNATLSVLFAPANITQDSAKIHTSLIPLESSGFIEGEAIHAFNHLYNGAIKSIFFYRLSSSKRPNYQDVVLLLNPNKSDIENLKTIWEVVRRVADRVYIYKGLCIDINLP